MNKLEIELLNKARDILVEKEPREVAFFDELVSKIKTVQIQPHHYGKIYEYFAENDDDWCAQVLYLGEQFYGAHFKKRVEDACLCDRTRGLVKKVPTYYRIDIESRAEQGHKTFVGLDYDTSVFYDEKRAD